MRTQEGGACFSFLRRCREDISGRFTNGQDAALPGLGVEVFETGLKNVKKRKETGSGMAERIHAEGRGSRQRSEPCNEDQVALLTNGALLLVGGSRFDDHGAFA